MGKIKRIILVFISVFVLCACFVIVYAYFSDTSEGFAEAQTGTIQVQLNDIFLETDENGAPIDTVKTFSGTNVGNKMAYVRAQVFPVPEYHYTGVDPSENNIDEWRPLAIPVSNFQINVTSPDWISGSDGYLYYSKILDPGEVTTEVAVTVQLPDPPPFPGGMDIRLNVRIVMESAQAANEAYKILFNISALPDGVEMK